MIDFATYLNWVEHMAALGELCLRVYDPPEYQTIAPRNGRVPLSASALRAQVEDGIDSVPGGAGLQDKNESPVLDPSASTLGGAGHFRRATMHYLTVGIRYLWVAPLALVAWVLYILPFWALGYIEFAGASPHTLRRDIALFHVVPGTWYAKLWAKWAGFALPFCIIANPASTRFQEDHRGLIVHERTHIRNQWERYGPLMIIIYPASLLFYGYSLHMNPLERKAERRSRKRTRNE